MRELKKWLAKLISRLMPTQISSGNGSMQIGKIDGNVTHVHLTQHIYSPPPIHMSRPDRRDGARHSIADAQKQVLALMDHVPDRIVVLDFMAREFKTKMVIELDAQQLYRLRRYVEVVLKNGGQS
ncbi:MAG: hypothetical protein FD135_2350 [Comamonadaceae bacterium]|nr:MAG: hypothetical protein FD135_2350 [Comamonadaceae bacterium]